MPRPAPSPLPVDASIELLLRRCTGALRIVALMAEAAEEAARGGPRCRPLPTSVATRRPGHLHRSGDCARPLPALCRRSHTVDLALIYMHDCIQIQLGSYSLYNQTFLSKSVRHEP